MEKMFMMGQSSRVFAPKLRSLFCLLLLAGLGGCSLISGSGDFEVIDDAGPGMDAESPDGGGVDGGAECMVPGDCGSADNGTFACTARACVLECDMGFDDCDADGSNGCEVDLSEDTVHCGMCGNQCPMIENGVAACSDGTCGIGACHMDYQLCDGQCIPIADVNNCGSCGNRCIAPNGVCSMTAEGTACAPSCGAGQMLCAGSCIDTTASTVHCGRCDNRCESGLNSAPVCEAGACLLDCEAGFGDCDDEATNGCEVTLASTAEHCGACGNDCTTMGANAAWGCADSLCEVAMCEPGFGDCTAELGCETDVLTDEANCGGCGVSCDGTCSDGLCEPFVQVTLGHHHMCVRNASGEVQCRGQNFRGQLGDGSFRSGEGSYVVRDEVGTRLLAQDVAAGFQHTCAIDLTGRILCWGTSTYGVIGNVGVPSSRARLLEGEAGFDALTFVQLSVGQSNSCALSSTGEVWCWGRGDNGRGGWGSTEHARMARRMNLMGNTATSISLGSVHGCALTTGNEVWCWGLTGGGRIGVILPTASTTPVRVATGIDEVAAGGGHTCAIDMSGALYCWGVNSSNELGLPGGERPTPQPVPIAMATELSLGEAHTCAKVMGEPRCWGRRNRGAIGDGDLGSTTMSPVAPTGVSNTATLFAGHQGTCAIDAGELFCWGNDFSGRLGAVDGTFRAVAEPALMTVSGLTSLSIGGGAGGGAPHACGAMGSSLLCWGHSASYATGRTSLVPSHMPTMISGAGPVSGVTTADGVTGYLAGGRAFAFGTNTGGRIVPEGASRYAMPQEVALPAAAGAIAQVGFGSAHGCARTANGVYCWGNNDRYQLGSTDPDRTAPFRVMGLPAAVDQLAVGSNFACTISSGVVHCWGAGNYSQLGEAVPSVAPTGRDRPMPQTVVFPTSATTPVAITAGFAHACVRTDTGQAYCWGRNHLGQAGGPGQQRSANIVLGSDVQEVRAYMEHTCARMGDGQVRCWGSNRNLELGAMTPDIIARTPVVVDGLSGANALARGSSSVLTCARTAAGVRCWGSCVDGVCAGAEQRAASPVAIVGFER